MDLDETETVAEQALLSEPIDREPDADAVRRLIASGATLLEPTSL